MACCVCLIVSFVGMIVTFLLYSNAMEAYLDDMTTPYDDAGRPFFHPMCIAKDWNSRTPDHVPEARLGCLEDHDLTSEMRELILGKTHSQESWNEWLWRRYLAYTDIGNKSVLFPRGYDRIAAWYLAWIA